MATKIQATLRNKWKTILSAWITIDRNKWDKINPEDIKNIYKYVFGMELLKIFPEFKQTLRGGFNDDKFVEDLLWVEWKDNARMLLVSLIDDEQTTKGFLDNDIAKIIMTAVDFYEFEITINDRKY